MKKIYLVMVFNHPKSIKPTKQIAFSSRLLAENYVDDIKLPYVIFEIEFYE